MRKRRTQRPRWRPWTGKEYLGKPPGRAQSLLRRGADRRTSPPIPLTATRPGPWRGSTMPCTTKSTRDILTNVDRFGQRHPQVFHALLQRDDLAAAGGSHRVLAAARLRLDGPDPRVQGGLHGHPRRGSRLLRPFRRQRPPLVRGDGPQSAVPQPRHRRSACGPQPPPPRSAGRVHARHQGDGRGHLRERRQAGGHRHRPSPTARSSRPTAARPSGCRRAKTKTSPSCSSSA